MNNQNSNTFLAMGLSMLVLVVWWVFYLNPKVEEERRIAELEAQRQQTEQSVTTNDNTQSGVIPQNDNAASIPDSGNVTSTSREEAVANDKRITLETDTLIGSINLTGARIDDIKLKKYRETLDPDSPLIELLSPRGTADAYFAEFGYTKSEAAGELPGPNTKWNSSSTQLSANESVVLDWTNEKGLKFERKIELDDQYMFTITDSVTNPMSEPVDITPYGRIARFGTPETENIFVLHEGLIGVLGDEGLQEIDYSDLQDSKEIDIARVDAGWLGITDKYWATAMIPTGSLRSKFAYFDNGQPLYQAQFVGEQKAISAGGTQSFQNRLFAGAKVTEIVDGYDDSLNILNFELLIDWGWFYFITKPLFWLIHWIHGIVGNFGFAILGATVIIKLLFLPLANMSYASMAKMKKVQPEMMELRERYAEDRMKQQQEMMALYKREKINPAAGCWPMLIQIPVFFALYKVLFVTIEMRQAPFIGWIRDLAAPDPSSIWNLFGLLPWEPGLYLPIFLLLGFWPLLMGITMFLQMQMNPAPPDPTQAMIFKWMPVVFTFLLATFPAGLVIYWAWNNLLSIIQQGVIMKRHGTKIELVDNLKGMFSRKSKEEGSG